jgi:hypothetical protein
VHVTLPIALPGLVATGIFTFLNGWDEFMFARTIVSSADKWVGTVGLASFIGAYVTAWDQILAAATIFTFPPVVLFLLVQKHFIAGRRRRGEGIAMHFALTEEQEAIRQVARNFAMREVRPCAKAIDERAEFDSELHRRLGDLGFLCMTTPEEFGGGGVDTLTWCVVVEEIAKASSAVANGLTLTESMAHYLATLGSEAQKREMLPELAKHATEFARVWPDGARCWVGRQGRGDHRGARRRRLDSRRPEDVHQWRAARRVVHHCRHGGSLARRAGIRTFVVRRELRASVAARNSIYGHPRIRNRAGVPRAGVPLDGMLGSGEDGLHR